MTVFLDTNILIDILTKRIPFYHDSFDCYKSLIINKCKIAVSTVTVADIMYITRKHFSDSAQQRTEVLNFLKTMRIVNTKKSDLKYAFYSSFSDFEDALQAHCSKRIHAKYIITRNVKHYQLSPVKAVTPTEFMN